MTCPHHRPSVCRAHQTQQLTCLGFGSSAGAAASCSRPDVPASSPSAEQRGGAAALVDRRCCLAAALAARAGLGRARSDNISGGGSWGCGGTRRERCWAMSRRCTGGWAARGRDSSAASRAPWGPPPSACWAPLDGRGAPAPDPIPFVLRSCRARTPASRRPRAPPRAVFPAPPPKLGKCAPLVHEP